MDDLEIEKVNTLAMSLRTLLCLGLPRVNRKKDVGLSESDRNLRLVLQIEDCRKHYEHSTCSAITQAMQDLIEIVKTREITIPHRNHLWPVFSRTSILQHVGQLFDPALNEIISRDSSAWKTLSQLGTPLPLSSQLNSRENLFVLANNLKTVAQGLEDDFESGTDTWKTMVEKSESLNAVADILDEIRFLFPVILFRWCEACFRRCRPDRKYCGLHTAGRASGKDTANRKYKSLKNALSPETLASWQAYTSIRKSLGDAVELVCYPEDIPVPFPVHGKLIMVPPSVKTLVDVTLDLPWSWASQRWEYILRHDFPKIFALIGRGPSEFQDWNEFAGDLLAVLEDALEKSKHPFWLLHIMASAEEWLTSERSKTDGRQTATKAKISSLFNSGVKDPKEIAKVVGKSKQYVYRVLKFAASDL